jgi:hypothetical protein
LTDVPELLIASIIKVIKGARGKIVYIGVGSTGESPVRTNGKGDNRTSKKTHRVPIRKIISLMLFREKIDVCS